MGKLASCFQSNSTHGDNNSQKLEPKATLTPQQADIVSVITEDYQKSKDFIRDYAEKLNENDLDIEKI